MNFVFISPNFPQTYWNFCERLRSRGVNVLGIGDASYDSLAPELKANLTEYYQVSSMEDYDQPFRAVAWFSHSRARPPRRSTTPRPTFRRPASTRSRRRKQPRHSSRKRDIR